MYGGRILIAYDVSTQYIEGSRRKIHHDSSIWGSELVIVLGGSGTFFRDDTQMRISTGDVFVLSGNYTKQFVDCDQLRVCSIYYKDASLQRNEGTFRRMEGYQVLFVQNPYLLKYGPGDYLHADAELLEDVENLIHRMEYELHVVEPGYEQVLNSTFLVLITLLSRAYSKFEQFQSTQINNMTRVFFYMQSHYNEKITLSQLADMAHLSERHFTRKFREIYRQSPAQYLLGVRLRRAASLLEETDHSISSIALECGFNDINYFSKAFKDAYHASPSQYRKARLNSMEQADWQEMLANLDCGNPLQPYF